MCVGEIHPSGEVVHTKEEHFPTTNKIYTQGEKKGEYPPKKNKKWEKTNEEHQKMGDIIKGTNYDTTVCTSKCSIGLLNWARLVGLQKLCFHKIKNKNKKPINAKICFFSLIGHVGTRAIFSKLTASFL